MLPAVASVLRQQWPLAAYFDPDEEMRVLDAPTKPGDDSRPVGASLQMLFAAPSLKLPAPRGLLPPHSRQFYGEGAQHDETDKEHRQTSIYRGSYLL